mgnify:CR=1 FL=1
MIRKGADDTMKADTAWRESVKYAAPKIEAGSKAARPEGASSAEAHEARTKRLRRGASAGTLAACVSRIRTSAEKSCPGNSKCSNG